MIRYGLYCMQPLCLLFGAGVPVLVPKECILPCLRLLPLPLPLLRNLLNCPPTLRLLRINAIAPFPVSPSTATGNKTLLLGFGLRLNLNLIELGFRPSAISVFYTITILRSIFVLVDTSKCEKYWQEDDHSPGQHRGEWKLYSFFLITVRPLIKYAKVKLRGLAALNGVKVSFAVRGIVLD